MAWCVAGGEKNTPHTHSSPQLLPSVCATAHTRTHKYTHTRLSHKAPSVLGLSVHQLMQSAGLGVLIITLLSGGLTKAHSHHTHMHTVQSAQGDCSV